MKRRSFIGAGVGAVLFPWRAVANAGKYLPGTIIDRAPVRLPYITARSHAYAASYPKPEQYAPDRRTPAHFELAHPYKQFTQHKDGSWTFVTLPQQ